MSTAEPEPDVAAAELALGVLDGDDRASALRRVLAEPAFARDVENWRSHFGLWFSPWPTAEPSADLLQRIEASISLKTTRIWPWKVVAGVSSLAAASLLVALLIRPAAPPLHPASMPQVAPLVASLSSTDKPGLAPVAAVYDRQTGQIRLGRATLAPPGRVAELWAIAADGVPRSLGVLAHGKPTTIKLPETLRGAMASGLTLAISIEPTGGSTTGLPTGPVVATGKFIQA